MQDNLTRRVLSVLGILIVVVIGVWLVRRDKGEEAVKPEIVLETLLKINWEYPTRE